MPGASAFFMFFKTNKGCLVGILYSFIGEVPSRFELLYAVLQTAT